MPQIGLPKIEIEEPKSLRVTLRGRLVKDLEEHRTAYQENYEVSVEFDALIAQILET